MILLFAGKKKFLNVFGNWISISSKLNYLFLFISLSLKDLSQINESQSEML